MRIVKSLLALPSFAAGFRPGSPSIVMRLHSGSKMATKPPALPQEARRAYARPDRVGDLAGSAFQLVTRLGTGAFVDGYTFRIEKEEPGDEKEYAVLRVGGYKVVESGATWGRAQPKKSIELYEFEGCPFCRKVREAVAILDLDVTFYPCPRDSPNYRPAVVARGGKAQFPYLVDKNTDTEMYESDAIIDYLFEKYGAGAKVPLSLRLGFFTVFSAGIGLIPRLGRGSKYRDAKKPKKPLELWGYEASPFTKVVRERLCELELPHKLISSARGSPKRQALFDKAGAGQTPYLVDPNTGAAGFESAEIADYLEATYAL